MKKKFFLIVATILALSIFSLGAWAAPGDSTDNPIFISTAAQLDAVRNGLNKFYKLSNDIDLTTYLAIGGDGYAKWGAEGWMPIGENAESHDFSGGFDGAGYKITGLWIERSRNYMGLFGCSNGAEIKNLGVEAAPSGIKGSSYAGLLLGLAQSANGANIITNCYTTGNIIGFTSVGGLVGAQRAFSRYPCIITDCYTTGNVSGNEIISIYIGGLVGNVSSYSNNSITNCYTTGNITNGNLIGGLVGRIEGSTGDCTVKNCRVSGNIEGGFEVGGLVGRLVNQFGCKFNITNCYSTGSIMGTDFSVGGLVGLQGADTNADCFITNCYATSNVSGDNDVGGLVGIQIVNGGNVSVTSCFSTGNVTASSIGVGGLVGNQSADVDGGTFNITTSYRYQLATVNGTVLTENTPNGIHGGIKTAYDFVTQTTYSDVGWTFNANSPWYWDNRGFPKLNLGTENYPFAFAPTPMITINTQPQSTTVMAGSISSSLSVVASVTPNGALSYQWYSNTTNNNTGGVLISGATNANFAIPIDLATGVYYYYCVVSAAGATSVSSEIATVTVEEESSGCNIVGYGYLAFALIGVVPSIRRMRK